MSVAMINFTNEKVTRWRQRFQCDIWSSVLLRSLILIQTFG